MICSNCGYKIQEKAEFCSNCGTKIKKRKFCTSCGAECKEGQLFCSVCGLKLDLSESDDVLPLLENGQLLMTLKLVSLYEGEPTLGFAKSTGQLFVYDNRLEFKKQMGNSLGGAFGLIGIAVAKNAVKKDSVETYQLTEISAFKVGKYGGVYNTLVLSLRSGKKITFCPAVPGSAEPQNIIEKLQPYL